MHKDNQLIVAEKEKYHIVTLIHNQEKNLNRIFSSYLKQTKQPDCYVFVLDRCTDNSHRLILEFSKNTNCKIVINNEGNGFRAGYCRDLGFYNIDNPEIILFIDGDCVPDSNKVFEECYKELNNQDKNVVLVSRVFEKENSLEIESFDRRCSIPWVKNKIFVEGVNNEVVDTYVSRWRALVISCCFGLNIEAINYIKKINLQIFNSDRIFPEIFDGNWGGEDEYIGAVAMLFNLRVCGVNPKHYVRHIWHPSNVNTSYEKKFDEVYNKLLQYAEKNNAPGLKNAYIDLNKIIFNIIKR